MRRANSFALTKLQSTHSSVYVHHDKHLSSHPLGSTWMVLYVFWPCFYERAKIGILKGRGMGGRPAGWMNERMRGNERWMYLLEVKFPYDPVCPSLTRRNIVLSERAWKYAFLIHNIVGSILFNWSNSFLIYWAKKHLSWPDYVWLTHLYNQPLPSHPQIHPHHILTSYVRSTTPWACVRIARSFGLVIIQNMDLLCKFCLR